MSKPFFITLNESLDVLSEIGIDLSKKQISRAAEPDHTGKRKLPFFVDPVDGKLKINKNTLLSIYIEKQVTAENNMRITD